MTDSPYHFPAAAHPLHAATDQLKVREAVSPFGITLRYQERAPDPPDAAPAGAGQAGTAQGRVAQAGATQGAAPEVGVAAHWCETGHSIFILAGRIRYTFDDHVAEAGPGDMLHIPAGRAHRHQPSVVGDEVVRYVLTEFD